ncbi:uncharacterized protein MKZ38_008297 [Zalerion maritima]|uniref:Uncharacterized protein n=1 Tax=Zalerion maritima TaxID=339359 RepID=A0AAD5WNQ4_9PEZI|nr:uncharacterized protein MKZ38_008297 [Zalerion maritima]
MESRLCCIACIHHKQYKWDGVPNTPPTPNLGPGRFATHANIRRFIPSAMSTPGGHLRPETAASAALSRSTSRQSSNYSDTENPARSNVSVAPSEEREPGRRPQRRHEGFQDEDVTRNPQLESFDRNYSKPTAVDIVLVPSIGGHSRNTWQVKGSCWILQEFSESDEVRFLVYRHREAEAGMTLDSASRDLLSELMNFRKKNVTSPRRGLVAKVALNMAMESRNLAEASIAQDCYGVTFFATPHMGSGVLSAPVLGESVQEVLRLSQPFPQEIARILAPGNARLQSINEKFREVAFQSLVKVWSFYETQDTQLTTPADSTGPLRPLLQSSTRSRQIPILKATISPMSSSRLGFSHEVLCGLELSHANCPTFHLCAQARNQYVAELKKSIANAKSLSSHFNPDLDAIERQIELETHSLYRGPDLESERGSLLRVWTSSKSLHQFLEQGSEDETKETELNQVPVQEFQGVNRTATWDRTPIKIVPLDGKSTYISRGLLLGRDASEDAQSANLRITLLQPSDKHLAVRWTHLPYTNPLWVKKILSKIQPDCKNLDFFKDADGSSFLRRGRYQGSYHGTCTVSGVSHNFASRPSPGVPLKFCNIRLPYLHYDSYKSLIRLREVIQLRLSHGRSNPVPGPINSVGLRVVWENITQEPPLNCRRTLDQYGYPMIRDSRARDDDQMIYKMSRAKRGISGQATKASYIDSVVLGGKWASKQAIHGDKVSALGHGHAAAVLTGKSADDVLDGKVLMVDSLWISIANDMDIVTFFPKRESFGPEHGFPVSTADLKESIYSAVNSDPTTRCDTPYDLAAFAVLHAVTVLIDLSSDAELKVFDMFDEAICILTETITTSLKSFRDGRASNIGFHGNSDIPLRHKLMHENYRAERLNRDCTTSMLDLRDCGDELRILEKLFREQSTVVEQLIEFYQQHGHSISQHGLGYLRKAEEHLGDYQRQAKELILRLDELDQPYNRLIDLVTRQGQWDEARWSRIQASLASRQAKSLMILSVASVIFMPLSFFTSLWGMEVSEWQDEGKLSLRLVGAISLPVSFFLCFVALAAAFSDVAYSVAAGISVEANDTMGRMRRLWEAKIRGTAAADGARRDASEGPTHGGRRTGSLWKTLGRPGPGRGGGLEMSVDFWDDQMGSKMADNYEIPLSNRNIKGKTETFMFNN